MLYAVRREEHAQFEILWRHYFAKSTTGDFEILRGRKKATEHEILNPRNVELDATLSLA